MLHDLKPWTTYRDNHNRQWVIISMDAIDWKKDISGDNIDKVYIYQVGTDQQCRRVSAKEFRSYIDNQLMTKI